MPATKPTSLGAVALQTGHANYGNLVRCYTMLDGSGTQITDSTSNNDHLTLNTASWNTSTAPYGLDMQHNHGSGDQIRATGGISYSSQQSYTMFARFSVDALDPTDSASGVIVSSGNKYGNSTIHNQATGITIDSDGDAHTAIANNDVREQWHDIPGTLGEGYITICWTYSYDGTPANAVFTTYRNGVEVSTLSPTPTQTQPPGSESVGEFAAPNSGTWIGASHNDDVGSRGGWNGDFDVLYIYDAALSATDVLALHNDPYAVIAAQGGGGSNADFSESAVIGDVTVTGLVCGMTVGGATPAGKPNTLGAIDLQTGNSLYTDIRNIWSFLDGSGTTVTDSIVANGDDFTLTVNDGATWNTASEPESLLLNHGDTGLQDVLKANSFVVPYQSDFSIHYRLKITAWDGGNNQLAILNNQAYASQGLSWLCDTSSGQPVLTMKLQDSSFQDREVTGMILPVDEWFDLVMTYEYNADKALCNLTGYLNGQSYAMAGSTDDSPGRFGTFAGGLFLNNTYDDDTLRGGDIECDILQIWEDRVLTQSDVTSLSNEPYQLLSAGGTAGTVSLEAVIGDVTVTGLTGTFSGDGFLSNDTGEAPITAIISQQPTLGTITDWTGDGSFTYVAGPTAGTDTIRYIASYGGLQPATEETITITINAPPSAAFDESAVIGGVTVTGLTGSISISGVSSANFIESAVIGEIDVTGLTGSMSFAAQAQIGDVDVTGLVGELAVGYTPNFTNNNPNTVYVMTYTSNGVLVVGEDSQSTVFTKQPNDVTLLDIDCSNHLGTGELLTSISSITCVSADNGSTTDIAFDTHVSTDGTPVISNNGELIQTLVSGGIDGGTYKIRLLAGTTYSTVKEFDFYISVSDI